MLGWSLEPGAGLLDKVLEAVDVIKTYGKYVALKKVSISVKSKTLTGLVGPNGSGKTTFIRLAVGITKPDGGTVRLFQEDPYNSPRARERLGYIPERPQLPSSLPIFELLRITAMIYGDPRPADKASEAIAASGLEGHEHKRFDQLSAGLKQRAAIAHALIHEPDFLIADEPTSNLDPVERMKILSLLAELNKRRGLTVLFTSHVLAEVSRLSDEIIVLLNGRIAFEGSPNLLVEKSRIVRIRTSMPEALARELAGRGYDCVEEAFSVKVFLESRREVGRLLNDLAMVSSQIPIFNIDTVEAALEELLTESGG
jgi:ABC-2 type transport system ATP-binding protein